MMREKAQIEAEHQKILAETARHKAEVEASLYVLQKERGATAPSAEAAVYEAAAEMEEEPLEDVAQITPEDRAQRTSEYVQTHSLAPPLSNKLQSHSYCLSHPHMQKALSKMQFTAVYLQRQQIVCQSCALKTRRKSWNLQTVSHTKCHRMVSPSLEEEYYLL